MFEDNAEHTLIDKTIRIIEHLKTESAFLDSAIESSLEIQEALRQHRGINAEEPGKELGEPLISESEAPVNMTQQQRNEALNGRLARLRDRIAETFLPIVESRREFVRILRSLDSSSNQTPSVTALALKVDEPYRSQLKEIRNDLRAKITQVQSISMGNQAVLIYTMDFYNRLLTGLSREQVQSNYYNAMGESQNQYSSDLLRTEC